ncbi:hypothetical protein DPMN_116849 [Dreissena polymorpha]|uniref:Uncharacterized protein n=1 Tax=Dreissena polymorpha TaxID=45954 RepID=A0A9D4KPP2_DREPO|nr:hypothetical protein DPMN_116849 [Dreissena polymorpha]
MSLHSEKCSILRVHRKRFSILHNYNLKGHILTSEETAKYLGVELTKDMSLKPHIQNVTRKGNSTL